MNAGSWEFDEPFIVTEDHLRLKWGGIGDNWGLICGFCILDPDITARPFEVGERCRIVHMHDARNVMVCDEHDGPDVADRWRHLHRSVLEPALRRWC